MKKIMFSMFLTIVTYFFSYGQYPTWDGKQYSIPLQIDSSDFFVIGSFPNDKDRKKYNFDQSNNSTLVNGWTNIFFYNRITKSITKPFDTSLIFIIPVLQFNNTTPPGAAYSRSNQPLSLVLPGFILFSVIVDYDRDGIIDENDPKRFFACSKDGKILRQITPDSLGITEWGISSDKKTILTKAKRDSNGDKKFINEDVLLFDIDLNNDISKIAILQIKL